MIQPLLRKLRMRLAARAQRRALARWTRAADRAPVTPAALLRQLRTQARLLQRQTDRVLLIAEQRLDGHAPGGSAIPAPPGSDWAARPPVWSAALRPAGLAVEGPRTVVARDATLFQDGSAAEILIGQIRNLRDTDLAPYALRIEVFRLNGSFVSLALDLPGAALQGLSRNHVLRVDLEPEAERPITAFVRLNILHGPNTERMQRAVTLARSGLTVEFDLAAAEFQADVVRKVWIDVILEHPEMNALVLRDLTISRRQRAEL